MGIFEWLFGEKKTNSNTKEIQEFKKEKKSIVKEKKKETTPKPKQKVKDKSNKMVKVGIGESIFEFEFELFKSVYEPEDHISSTEDIDYYIQPWGNTIESIDLDSLDPDGQFFSCAKYNFDGGHIIAFYFENCTLPKDLAKKYGIQNDGCDIFYKDGKPLNIEQSKIFTDSDDSEEIDSRGWVLYRYDEDVIREIINSGDR